MAELSPFKGILYNPAKIKDLSKVVSLPYDVISPNRQDKFYQAHPCNIIRIDFGKIFPHDGEKNNHYTRARSLLKKWLKEKILIQDNLPSLYLLSQDFDYQGKKFSRLGFICRLKLRNDGSVLFHEKTSPGPKRDRFKLLSAIKANLNPIFALFEDDSRLIPYLKKSFLKKKPFVNFNFQGIKNRLWRITDDNLVDKIIKIFLSKKIFIADGHHRYQANLAYQRYSKTRNPCHTGKEDYNYTMVYLTPLEDRALKILPTHRLFRELPRDLEKHLEPYFDTLTFSRAEKMFSFMDRVGAGEHVFGMYQGKNKFRVLKIKEGLKLPELIRTNKPLSWKKLDVSIFHSLVVEKIFKIRNSDFKSIYYIQNPQEAIREVDRGNFKIAFFFNSTQAHQVKEVAEDAVRMPHKSTYFYPKLLSGLVMNPVQNFSLKNFE